MDAIISQEAIPFLSQLTAAACVKFRDQAESYSARGGTKKLRGLVSTQVRRIIAIKDKNINWTTVSDEDFLLALIQLHAPKSKLDALTRFKSIAMKGKNNQPVDPEAVMSFIMRFMDLNAQS
jgi:hypothetical protein